MRADAVFCSAKCNMRARSQTRYQATRSGGVRLDARQFRAFIAERSNWTCALCANPVDPNLEHPHTMYGSIDHIIPLAVGGSNEMDNLQLAHLSCNARKRQHA